MRWVAVHYGSDGNRAVFRNLTGDSREDIWRKQVAISRKNDPYSRVVDPATTTETQDHTIIGYLALNGWAVEPDVAEGRE
jgi:hypothetical protein